MDEVARILLMQEIARRTAAGTGRSRPAAPDAEGAAEPPRAPPDSGSADLIDVLIEKLKDADVRRAFIRLLSGR